MRYLLFPLLAACLPVDLSGTGRRTLHAQDYVVESPRIVALRARQTEANGPFDIEPLVIGGTLDLTFEVCGFEPEQATFDTDVICLDDPDLFVEIEPDWHPPLEDWGCVDYPIEYWDGENYDWTALYADYATDEEFPGWGCSGWYSLLVTGEDGDYSTRFVQSITVDKARVPGYETPPEPIPITMEATGSWTPGSRVQLDITAAETDNPDASFSTVHWWITGGELTQAGRTALLPRTGSDALHTRNTLVVPDLDTVTIAVVLHVDDWDQPAVSWTTQTFEVTR